MQEFLNKRIQTNTCISEDLYVEGLLDVTQLLCFELDKYLEKENRHFGVAVSYMNSINGAFQRLSVNISEDNYELYGKILYLFKPAILKEFYKLRKRKVSEADCLIVILKRMLDVLVEEKNNSHLKETKTIHKIITKFYDNIRNAKKAATLSGLVSTMKELIESGQVGKYSLDHFSIEEEEEKRKKTVLSGDGTRMENKKDGWEIDL